MTLKTIMAVTSLAAALGLSAPAYSQAVEGRPGIVYADPSDLVIGLAGVNGPCGSNLFHLHRNNENFREVTAVTLTAYASGKTMTLFVTSCGGANRNIIDHVAVHD